MPTGYTAGVADGNVTDLHTFIWSCARAFGALVMMRDDPSDAPIPQTFQPDTHSRDALVKARERLAELDAMTPEAADAAANAAYVAEVESWERRSRDRAVEAARYRAMLDQVVAWKAPSADHVELRKFMIEQLTDSMKFDCGGEYDKEPTRQTGAEWHAESLKREYRSVGYFAKDWAEEQERVEGRNRWLAALRQSLESPAATTR